MVISKDLKKLLVRYKKYRIDKKQSCLTKVQIYMIEEILKNAPLCTFANKIKTKNAIFVNNLTNYYTKEFKIPMSISVAVVLRFLALLYQ